MATELRAYNAQGEQLFFTPDTDARQFETFDTVGAAFDRMESIKSAWRWVDRDRGFVRNRVAMFRMDDEEWSRARVAEHAQYRAARNAALAGKTPQEAQEPAQGPQEGEEAPQRLHVRTVDEGKQEIIPTADALAEINHAMMGGRRDVREMSEAPGEANITYRDGRRVTLRPFQRPQERRARVRHANAYEPAYANVVGAMREMPRGGALRVHMTNGDDVFISRDDLHALCFDNADPDEKAAAVARIRAAVNAHIDHGARPVYLLLPNFGMRPSLYLADIQALLNRWDAAQVTRTALDTLAAAAGRDEDNARTIVRDIWPAAVDFAPVVDDDTHHGWTFSVPGPNGTRYGWANGRNGMCGPLWDTLDQARTSLTTRPLTRTA